MKARILIVEDERAIRLALSGLLRREGYEIDQAETGEEAIPDASEPTIRHDTRNVFPRATADDVIDYSVYVGDEFGPGAAVTQTLDHLRRSHPFGFGDLLGTEHVRDHHAVSAR